ncbi:hypothetical protein ACIBF5_16060 [Micromonospora sp. NPDC050417]|uniref:hypothetical protein n=1 Tax=Micromonospora sp. NPDC050417 TaxID=3364280 RepID=UPI0037BD79EF
MDRGSFALITLSTVVVIKEVPLHQQSGGQLSAAGPEQPHDGPAIPATGAEGAIR